MAKSAERKWRVRYEWILQFEFHTNVSSPYYKMEEHDIEYKIHINTSY